jgi:hypothetical protein
MRFPPDQLDLDRLIDNLATRKLELAQYTGVVTGLEPGDEQDAWAGEVERVETEIAELEKLIVVKREYDRGNRR